MASCCVFAQLHNEQGHLEASRSSVTCLVIGQGDNRLKEGAL